MKKLIIFILCLCAIAVSAQRTPYDLQALISKQVALSTTDRNKFKKWQEDKTVPSAFLKDADNYLNELFIRNAPDTMLILEHNFLLNEWLVRITPVGDSKNKEFSEQDKEFYTVDSTGKVLRKTRPYTGLTIGNDDGSLKVYMIVDKVDRTVNFENTYQIASSSAEAKSFQAAVDALLAKF